MKTSIALSFATLLAASGSAFAASSAATNAETFSALSNIEATPLAQSEMASTYGKHLTITNGTGSWEHPVSAFHGTLTITPRGGAVLEITERTKP
jgi:hypothetical protein